MSGTQPGLPKGPTPKDRERTHTLWLLVIDRGATIINTTIRCGALVLIVYFGVYRVAQEAAGKTTILNMVQEWIVGGTAWHAIALLVGGSGVGYGWWERRKRLKEREIKDKRNAELEQKLDPNRSSSKLDPTGENP